MDRNSVAPPHSPLARLLIVDDHELARASLRLLLSGEPDLDVVGVAVNGKEAVACCRTLHPDLVLMNVRMPIMDGITATHLIRKACPATKVLLLSIMVNTEYRTAAQQAGAAGYLLKEATRLELVTAIRQVLARKRLFE
jgi:DNA-binding NarL/FixJ family response regulator